MAKDETMARKKASTPDKEPGFEEAIARLEAIVAAMEEEQLPLEDLVTRDEEGTRLLARCEAVLADARKRLITIAARGEDEAGESPAGADEFPDPNASGGPDAPDDDDDDDDIRLF